MGLAHPLLQIQGGGGASGPPAVLAGSQGTVLHITWACPLKAELQILASNLGQHDAIMAAHQAGCEVIPIGTTGLVLDNFGSSSSLPLDKLKLSDGEVLWFEAKEIGPLNYNNSQ